MTETLRSFCQDIESFSSSLNKNLHDYFNLYLDKMSTRGLSDAIRNKMIIDAGNAMKAFIDLDKLTNIGVQIQSLKSYKILQTVFEQNFFIIKDKENNFEPSINLIKVSTGKGHISSPHESEAEYANKGKKSWIGYKTQIVETINDDDNVNFITHAEITPATTFDGDALIPAISNLKNLNIAPSEVYGDTHYNTKENIEQASLLDIEMKGPVSPRPTKETQEKNEGFKIDVSKNVIICPNNIESKKCVVDESGRYFGSFPQNECNKCERRDTCQPEIRGKRISIRKEHDILKTRREQMKTEEFKEDMHKRNGIEGTLSGLVRGQGIRRMRYRGLGKAGLQIKFSATAANISRLHRSLTQFLVNGTGIFANVA
jgi:hypothetical protein